jgi:hypothetical protein
MTVAELHTSFKFGMDKLDSLNYPNFESEEVDLLLNKAQERFVKQRIGITNTKRQSFEETQKRTDDIKALVSNSILTPTANSTDNKPNGKFVTLPTDYWFAINEECDITYINCHGEEETKKRGSVKAIQHDDYATVVEDPFNKPWKKEVIRLMENGKIELITANDQDVTKYYLRYIKRPLNISLTGNVTSELSDHTHQEIVDLAIQIALEGIEAKRTQTFDKIVNTNE